MMMPFNVFISTGVCEARWEILACYEKSIFFVVFYKINKNAVYYSVGVFVFILLRRIYFNLGVLMGKQQ